MLHSIWTGIIVLLVVGAATESIVISMANVSSTCTIQCSGTIDYASTRTIQCNWTIDYTRQTFDLNHDGKVDIVDVEIVARAFRSCPEQERWDPSLDLNQDGQINEVDPSTLANNCWRK